MAYTVRPSQIFQACGFSEPDRELLASLGFHVGMYLASINADCGRLDLRCTLGKWRLSWGSESLGEFASLDEALHFLAQCV